MSDVAAQEISSWWVSVVRITHGGEVDLQGLYPQKWHKIHGRGWGKL